MILDDRNYYNYLSIKSNILNPLNKFMSFDEIVEVCKNLKFNNKFFPIPFFISCNLEEIKKIKGSNLDIFYKNKRLDKLKILSIQKFDKNKISFYLFNKKRNHPYNEFIKNSKEYVIETAPFAINSKKLEKNYKLVGFATRNIPHKGHEKILINFIKKRKKIMVIINSDISNNKKINPNNTFKAYKKFINKNKIKGKISLEKISLPSLLLGFRQAALHSIIAKNFGCRSFIIGRDHSGYKKFYKEFESFNFCKKNEKKIGVKILPSGSPLYCNNCEKIVFRDECKCKNKRFNISSTLVRKLKDKKLKKLISNF